MTDMGIPQDYSFTRYLAAKKSVDDRALNRRVWECLAGQLPKGRPSGPLRVLEIGAGIGTMVERMLERNLVGYTQYTALDALAENMTCARERLTGWGKAHGYRVSSRANRLIISNLDQKVSVYFENREAFEFARQVGSQRQWDLLVAHAFLDLVDLSSGLHPLFRLLRDGGSFYFSANFDGMTAFEPPFEPDLERQILALYHRSMDLRRVDGRPSGDSHTGRRLFQQIPLAGGEILEAGSSDWVVYPRRNGYPEDEAYFLHFILHTIYKELYGHPQLDPERLAAWAAERHAQVEKGQLVYLAHQLDFTGRFPKG